MSESDSIMHPIESYGRMESTSIVNHPCGTEAMIVEKWTTAYGFRLHLEKFLEWSRMVCPALHIRDQLQT